MKRVALRVETLRCEASEAQVLEALLARNGILTAEVDLDGERVAVAYDERVTTETDVVEGLRFFGLHVRPNGAPLPTA